MYIEKRFVKFLTNFEQSLNFINALSPSKLLTIDNFQSIYAVMLKGNGRFDFDFFITKIDDYLILDADDKFSEAIDAFFKKYKLKNAKFEIKPSEDKEFCQKFYIINNSTNLDEDIVNWNNQNNNPDIIIHRDGRFLIPNKTVLRVLMDHKMLTTIDSEVKKYFINIEEVRNIDDFFIENEIVNGSWLIREKSIILEYGFDKLCNESVIDFNKGCYLGQELITRVKRSGVIRKRVKKITNEDNAKHSNADIIKIGSKSTLILESIKQTD